MSFFFGGLGRQGKTWGPVQVVGSNDVFFLDFDFAVLFEKRFVCLGLLVWFGLVVCFVSLACIVL